MKPCASCGQMLSERLVACPGCGAALPQSRASLGSYLLLECIHEGSGCLLFRARREGENQDVLVRMFTANAGMDEGKAALLRKEIEEINRLLGESYVRHFELGQDQDGTWFRVSEWIEQILWSELVANGCFEDRVNAFRLFSQIAGALVPLHQTGRCIPHLVLYDLLVFKDAAGDFRVKVDVKLSRFLEIKPSQAPPLLKWLLETHPDIVAGRPLDQRADVWSLGSIFIGLLSGLIDCGDPAKALEALELPKHAKILLGRMIESDPDLRIASMENIAAALEQLAADCARQESVATGRIARRTGSKILLIFLALITVIAVVVIQLRFGILSHNDTTILARHARHLAPSVALIGVEYTLKSGTTVLNHGAVTGTGFLASKNGLLLTNRHVACPWLESAEFNEALQKSTSEGQTPEFEYRIVVLFENTPALKHMREELSQLRLDDILATEKGWRSDGKPKVRIAGVLAAAANKAALFASPLQDDAAVLQLDPPPTGLTPLPLTSLTSPEALPCLSPVAAIGYPLGVQAMDGDIIHASVTMGRVRRGFPNILQCDVSLHGGNSGGPVIDLDGNVLGIASAVQSIPGFLAKIPHSDYSLVLPVTRARKLLSDAEKGKPIWDGIPDPGAMKIWKKACERTAMGDWSGAAQMWENRVGHGTDAASLSSAGVLWLCAQKPERARTLCEKALRITPDNTYAKGMLALADWKEGKPGGVYHKELTGTDWRSPSEFWGYFLRVLDGDVSVWEALNAGEDRTEQTLLGYAVALREAKAGRNLEAAHALRLARVIADVNSPELLLLNAERPTLLSSQDQFIAPSPPVAATESGQRIFLQKVRAYGKSQEPEKKRKALDELIAHDPDYKFLLVLKVLGQAQNGDWSAAATSAGTFMTLTRRESANRLAVGILQGQLIKLAGDTSRAQAIWDDLARQTRDPWHKALARMLKGEITSASLEAEAAQDPKKAISFYNTLALNAEAERQPNLADNYYRKVLETGLSTFAEYELAKARLAKLRGGK